MLIVSLIYFVVVNYLEKGKLIFFLVSIAAAVMSSFVPNVWIWSHLAALSVFFAIGAYLGENLGRWMTFFSKDNVFGAIFTIFIIVNIMYIPILYLHSSFFQQIYWYITSFVGLSFVLVVSTKISGNLILDYSPRYLGHEIASGRSESNVWSVANTD
ncbi:hypothetical protein EFP43_12080 [Lacticaseibacillus paracasei]|nr:hypothetical protein [Lacticaseibacillus paracasei]